MQSNGLLLGVEAAGRFGIHLYLNFAVRHVAVYCVSRTVVDGLRYGNEMACHLYDPCIIWVVDAHFLHAYRGPFCNSQSFSPLASAD